MKKNYIRSAIIISGALIFSYATTTTAATATTNLNVTGTVVDNTCTASWNGATTDVAFGRVSVNDFAASNRIATTRNFTLELTSCATQATGVSVSATGTADTTDNMLFANSASTGAATNVGVALMGGANQATQLNPAGTNSVNYTVTGGTISMPFTARFMKTSTSTTANATLGSYSSTITLTVTYL